MFCRKFMFVFIDVNHIRWCSYRWTEMRPVPLVDHELFAIPIHPSQPHCLLWGHVQYSVFCVMFCELFIAIFFWPLYCMSFHFWLLRTSLLWYFQHVLEVWQKNNQKQKTNQITTRKFEISDTKKPPTYS